MGSKLFLWNKHAFFQCYQCDWGCWERNSIWPPLILQVLEFFRKKKKCIFTQALQESIFDSKKKKVTGITMLWPDLTHTQNICPWNTYRIVEKQTSRHPSWCSLINGIMTVVCRGYNDSIEEGYLRGWRWPRRGQKSLPIKGDIWAESSSTTRNVL